MTENCFCSTPIGWVLNPIMPRFFWSFARIRVRLAIFIPSFGDGGVERMLINLAGGLVARGLEVDFLTRSRTAPYLDALAPGVRLIEAGRGGVFSGQVFLCAYLKQSHPDIVLCGKDKAAQAVLIACRLTGVSTRLVMRPGTNFSARFSELGPWSRWRTRLLVRWVHRAAAAVVGNSASVVADIAKVADLPADRVHLIRNPVVTPQLITQAAAALDHPWFAPDAPPVVMGVGRLGQVKGFDTLLRAFAALRQQRPCRLMILGDGRLRADLLNLAAQLDVADDVALPGFDPNPYRYLKRAALFVLSSRREGSPNALTEALALGTPVVATDCPSGPREVLRDGAVAPLVPVDDVEALAAAMGQVLDAPGDAAVRQAAVAEYTVDVCAERYAALLKALKENE